MPKLVCFKGPITTSGKLMIIMNVPPVMNNFGLLLSTLTSGYETCYEYLIDSTTKQLQFSLRFACAGMCFPRYGIYVDLYM